MKLNITLRHIFSLIFLLLTATLHLQAQDLAEGETLFKNNCSSCHRTSGAVLIGPPLGGAKAKYENDKDWLHQWVRNSPGLINSGDAKAVALFEQYNRVLMTPFPALTDEQIDNILAWAEEDAKPKVDVAVNGTTPSDPFADPKIYYTLLALVGILVMISLILVVITATLVSAVKAKDGGEPLTLAAVRTRTVSLLKNKFVITAIIVVALTGGTTKSIIEARKIGLHQGYMPEQPIKFSHKLHAGTHKIDCEYCHSGVRKSKNAWIPSVNVCMNCHKYIQNGPQYGTEEIAKVLAAWNEQKPIEWVRIHNLPDHAYFNHAQHVVVGGLKCQTCHGPVEEMEVVYQFSDLGMGWCIDCHRKEPVKLKDIDGNIIPTTSTVEDMGGLDCMRCHY